MFSWLRLLAREKDDSFDVKIVGRSEVVYSEKGGRRLSIYCEFEYGGKYDLAIFLNRAQHWDGGAEISLEDREKVRERLSKKLHGRIEWPDW